MIEDHFERQRALDPTASFIVQAPAGSGKTELLIRRYIALLAQVDTPESIVAITFTKKAAGEMRTRVIEALRLPAHQELAARWRLLENPARLRIQTIDSLSASITSRMPWLSRFGARPKSPKRPRISIAKPRAIPCAWWRTKNNRACAAPFRSCSCTSTTTSARPSD